MGVMRGLFPGYTFSYAVSDWPVVLTAEGDKWKHAPRRYYFPVLVNYCLCPPSIPSFLLVRVKI